MTKNNQSVAKALQIIEMMAAGTGPMRLQEISAKLKLPASTVLRFLGTLIQFNYVQQDAGTLQYSLTMKFCRLGHLVSSQVRLRDVVRPFLFRLTEEFKESASLAVAEEQRVLYIDSVDGPDQMLQTLQRIGRVAPLHNTGVGKTLLLEFSDEQLDQLIETKGLEATTKNTITDPERLARELRKVERQGFALDDQECEMGVRCVAAPLRDYTGRIVAAISVSGPLSRMTPAKMTQVRNGVMRAAAEISDTLGFDGQLSNGSAAARPMYAGSSVGPNQSSRL